MRIDVITTTPNNLETAIFNAVSNGTLTTYELKTLNTGERRLTPIGNQFKDIITVKFERVTNENILRVTFNFMNDKPRPTEALYAIVLGMVTAMLVTHFKTYYAKIEIIA